MYRLNLLKRNVLITTDEVIFHAPTKHTLDPKMIEHSIIIAEERFIVPDLGYNYYEALIAEKNLVITSGNAAAQTILINASLPAESQPVTIAAGDIVNAAEYLSADNKALWDRVLWKFLAECVMITAYPEGFVQFGTAGTVHEAPPGSNFNATGNVSPELRSVKWVMDKKMSDRIEPLRNAMHVWLCKQKEASSSKYPLYEKECDCDVDGVAYKRKTDMILGIYDDDDEENNNCCD